MEKICKLCAKAFIPSKYRPASQEICSDPVCQHKRQLENMKLWRRRNPHYFKQEGLKGAYWHELYKRRIRKWRKEHPEYFKAYREKYKDQHREYMKEYMRRYRGIMKKSMTESQEAVSSTPKVLEQEPQMPQAFKTPPQE